MNRPRLAAALVALLATFPIVALSPAASAYPGPTTSASYSVLSAPGLNVTWLSLSGAENGSAVAAWVESDGSNASVKTADLSAAGAWGPARVLFSSNESTIYLSTARDGAGDVAVSWFVGSSPSTLMFAQRLAGGAWSNATPVAAIAGGTYVAGQPRFASGPGGRLFFAWGDSDGGRPIIHAAVADPAFGVVGPVALTNGSYQATGLALAPGPSGDALVLWFEWNDTPFFPESDLIVSRFAAGFGWSAPSLGLRAYRAPFSFSAPTYPPIAVASTNTANATTLVWFGTDGNTTGLAFTEGTSGGNWTAPSILEENATNLAVSLSLSPAADGSYLVTWALAYYDVFGSGGYTGWARAAVLVPTSGWRAKAVLAEGVPSYAFVAGSARSATTAVVAVGYDDLATSGPQLAQLTDFEGCGGWSALHGASTSTTHVGAVAVNLPASGPGTLVYTTTNASRVELRAASFTLPVPPPITIDSPSDGAVFDRAFAILNGTALPNDTAWVGGYSGTANASGRFSVRVPLLEGDNNFTVVVARAGAWAPCMPSLRIRLVYVNPVPALMAELAAAEARIAALETASGDLNVTRAQLADALAALDNASADLDRIKVQFPWLQDNLTAAQAALNESRTRLAETNARLDAQAAATNRSSADAADARARADTASSTTALATLLGTLGMALGAAGLGAAVISMRRRQGGGASEVDKKSP